MIRVLTLVYFALVPFLSIVRAQVDSASTRYVGRTGDIFISEREFLDRFEMLPALYRHRKPQLDVAKMELMYSLVAEKLLAQEAQSRNLDRDSLYKGAMLDVRKLLARDQLYNEEVRNKVSVSAAELTKGIREARNQILVAFIYCANDTDAQFLRNRMTTPADFDKLVPDSTMNVLRDTATVIWGDAKQSIQEAAYKLRTGEISPVVKAGDGWYILKCLSISPNALYGAMSSSVLRDRVERALREQKESVRMKEFLATAFQGRVGYARPGPLRDLAGAVQAVFGEEVQQGDTTLGMTTGRAQLVRARLAGRLQDTLAVAGNTAWRVGDVLARLVAKGFSMRREDVSSIPQQLNIDIGFWVQQELLGQEALERKLDQLPAVQRQLEIWSQASLADMMKEYARRHVHVTDDEVWKYLAYEDKKTPIPQVQLRELRTSSLDEMRQALDALQQGMTFEQAVRRWSDDPESQIHGGLTPPFPITERAPLGGIAWQIDVGQRYGPVRVGDHVYLFELVAKNADPVVRDTSFVARKDAAAKELLAMKQKRTITLFLSQTAEKRGFEIYQDRLMKLQVSPIPMMTFRFLGFGGRMFEVPFVDPQLQWLDVEPPKETVLP